MGSNASGNSGSVGAWRVNTDQEFDPKYGFVTIETWEGIKSVIIALRNAWANAGYRSRITHRGPTWMLQVRFGYDPSQQEDAVDRYTIDMEPVQVSIWSCPAFDAALGAYDPVALSLLRKDIEDAVKNGEGLPVGVPAIGASLYRLLIRGVEGYEIKRPVLTRTRTFSIAYNNQMTVDGVERVYTRASLQSTFSIPAGIIARIPESGGTAPTETAWAWKLTVDRSEIIPALGKIQETRTWVFAAWSTVLYTLT